MPAAAPDTSATTAKRCCRAAARLINSTQLGCTTLPTSCRHCRVVDGAVGTEGNIAHNGGTTATAATHRQPVQNVLGEDGERVVVAAKCLAGGRSQARVVAAGAVPPRAAAPRVVSKTKNTNRDAIFLIFIC